MADTFANITHVTRAALRRGLNDNDADGLVGCSLAGIANVGGPARLKVMCHFVDGTGIIYLHLDDENQWVGDW